MKMNIIIKSAALLFTCALVGSCEYKNIARADYPAQVIYLPAAVNGIYTINDLPVPNQAYHPTPGNTYRFTVSPDSNAFVVPLSVYRSGINSKGAVPVDIKVNTDTVATLISAGQLQGVELLPSDKYTLTPHVDIADGSDNAAFNLRVNLDFLGQSAPAKKYALGISVSSSQRKTGNSLGTMVVLIDTKMMLSTAGFNFTVDNNDWQTVHFTNTSQYGTSSSWDFGDGSVSSEINPSHTYAGKGTYTVKLSSKGLYGNVSTKTVVLQIFKIEKIDKSIWKMVSFDSQEPAETNWHPYPTGYAIAAIDGDLNTYWHTQWTGSNPPGYPHWFIVDMGQNVIISSFECFRRQGNGAGQTECQFFTSMDGTNWTDQGVYPFDPNYDGAQSYPMVNYPKARYFKYVATKGPNFYAFLAEINVYGTPAQ